MSLASACLWTLARTLVICLIAWPVCVAVERWLRGLSDAQRGWGLVGLLAPFCFPELLVGYACRDLALFHPRWAEALCSGLLLVRVVPVGAIALMMAPPPACDAAAMHCRRLLVRARRAAPRAWLELARCYWHGPIVRTLPALGLMALVAFQEFELAALLMTTSWSDWFVAAERVGLDRGEMLRQTAWPLLMQWPVMLGIVGWLRRGSQWEGSGSAHESDVGTSRRMDATSVRSSAETDGRGVHPTARIRSCFAGGYVALALVAGCVVPLSLIGWRTLDGLSLLLRQRTQQMGLAREIAISGAVSLCAGLTAWAICRGSGLTSPTRERGHCDHSTRSPRSRVGLIWGVILLPGLLGSMLLSLGAVGLFQGAWLRPLYDTPLPWVLALTLWLLPRAAVLQLWLDAMQPSEAVHLAEMASGGGAAQAKPTSIPKPPHPSALLWRLRDQPQFLAIGLLCYWAYCDLPTAYLLAPTGMASGLVRLYNFMHFGRSAALSAEASLFFIAPLMGVGLVMMVARGWRR